MKYFTLSILFSLFTFSLFAQFVDVDWTALDLNEPTERYIRSTSVVSEEIIWGLFYKEDNPNNTSDHFFRTTDGGQTFEIDSLPFSIDDAYTSIDAIDENIAFINAISVSTPFLEGIYKTLDGGQNWELIYDAETLEIQPFFTHFFNSSEGTFIGAIREGSNFDLTSYYTQDGGILWTPSSEQISLNTYALFGGNATKEVINDTIWIVGSRILRSTDKGQSWEEFETGIQGIVLSDIAFKDGMNGLAVAPTNTSMDLKNVLVQTNDGGETWTEIDFPISNNLVQVNTIEYIPGTAGSYIISNGDFPNSPDASLFAFTNDNGTTWQVGIAPYRLYCTDFLSSEIGFGGSDISTGGLLKFNDNIFDEITSLKLIKNEQIKLFPNPAKNLINIQLENEMEGNLTLNIINNLGQVILQSKTVSSVNHSNIELDISNIPTGNYRVMISNSEYLVVKNITKI